EPGPPKARLRPMRGLTRPRSVVVVTGGHALVQNIRRGHYELAVDRDNCHRVADAFDELMIAI
ncbi:MAG: transposase, family, partial [Acidimicrobiaceae bacterium]|nr:transposase, family [Acidimicrobiaceae bacterium]